ncbi:hypothetical protein RSSM_02252 [Rhodopirellula sallentina SM41]|uniref:Uncharacterized protein n=1 Tax=Rhodopirellula sallentina SM41 TaxID=1263870 RepID=M5U4V9_9BACT|nr:hypothetical protein RSSM_02252 [Rhodopirellula sallentina SM41]
MSLSRAAITRRLIESPSFARSSLSRESVGTVVEAVSTNSLCRGASFLNDGDAGVA